MDMPIIVNWPFSNRKVRSRVVRKLNSRSVQWRTSSTCSSFSAAITLPYGRRVRSFVDECYYTNELGQVESCGSISALVAARRRLSKEPSHDLAFEIPRDRCIDRAHRAG